MLMTGAVLQSRYSILRLLGQGGMSSVYQAEDLRLGGRLCAIKENVPAPGSSPQQLAQLRQQFQVEASILASLNHANLPKVWDYFTEGNKEYLVMEFVEGEDLESVLHRIGGSLPEGQVVQWARQVLDALTYLHSQQPFPILHRDIKPANIILTPQNQVKLVDFGLVKRLDLSNPQTATVMRGMGTPEYTPLEQYSTSGHTDARSDLYAVGATLYHLLTGVLPPSAPQRLGDSSSLGPIRQYNPSISPSVEQTVMQAMALKSNHRFGSAEEMRAALVGGSHTRVVTPPPPPPPPARHWWWAAGASAAFIFLVLFAWLVQNRTPPPPSPPTTPGGDATLTVTPSSRTNTPTPRASPVKDTVTLEDDPSTPTIDPTPGPSRTAKLTPTISRPLTQEAVAEKYPTQTNSRELLFSYASDQIPNVDGNLSEWRDSEFHQLPYNDFKPENVTSSSDLDTSIATRWTDSHFYVAVRIVDDRLFNVSRGDQLYRGDGIELSVDAALDRDFGDAEMDGDDYQIGIQPGQAFDRSPEVYRWYPKVWEGSIETFAVESQRTADGYDVEIRIPWGEIGIVPRHEGLYGFDIAINDDDTLDNPEQESKMTLSRNHSFHDPTTWGVLVLIRE